MSSGRVRGGAGARGGGWRCSGARIWRPLSPDRSFRPADRFLEPGANPSALAFGCGARVPGRVAGAPLTLRGAPATAAGLHPAAAARGRPAVAAAGSLLRRQPQGPAFPGAAAAPGRRPGPGRAPVPSDGGGVGGGRGGLDQSRASVSPFIAPVQTPALPAVNLVP